MTDRIEMSGEAGRAWVLEGLGMKDWKVGDEALDENRKTSCHAVVLIVGTRRDELAF
jgi:hypothetical protein